MRWSVYGVDEGLFVSKAMSGGEDRVDCLRGGGRSWVYADIEGEGSIWREGKCKSSVSRQKGDVCIGKL